MTGDDLKHCGHGCGLVKHRDEFGNDTSRPDGKDIYCKACRARKRKRKALAQEVNA